VQSTFNAGPEVFNGVGVNAALGIAQRVVNENEWSMKWWI
jgi:hypothetical protein